MNIITLLLIVKSLKNKQKYLLVNLKIIHHLCLNFNQFKFQKNPHKCQNNILYFKQIRILVIHFFNLVLLLCFYSKKNPTHHFLTILHKITTIYLIFLVNLIQPPSSSQNHPKTFLYPIAQACFWVVTKEVFSKVHRCSEQTWEPSEVDHLFSVQCKTAFSTKLMRMCRYKSQKNRERNRKMMLLLNFKI